MPIKISTQNPMQTMITFCPLTAADFPSRPRRHRHHYQPKSRPSHDRLSPPVSVSCLSQTRLDHYEHHSNTLPHQQTHHTVLLHGTHPRLHWGGLRIRNLRDLDRVFVVVLLFVVA